MTIVRKKSRTEDVRTQDTWMAATSRRFLKALTGQRAPNVFRSLVEDRDS